MSSDENNVKKPWLSSSGNLYDDDVLKQISKTWSADTWEEFLKETVERGQGETLIPNEGYDEACKVLQEAIWNDGTPMSPESSLAHAVRKAIRDHLTNQQQGIIRLLFWAEQSHQKTATALGISKKQVLAQKRSALKKLKKGLERWQTTR